MTTTFEDWHAINSLLMAYADHVDSGRNAEVGAMFEDATYRVERADGGPTIECQGSEPVIRFCQQTRLYEGGTPRTKHVVSNVEIEVDGDDASSRCYVTVFQQTDVLPLQPIASGRYIDRFRRVGGRWCFADRLITGFLLGDRSQHVTWHEGAPEEAVS